MTALMRCHTRRAVSGLSCQMGGEHAQQVGGGDLRDQLLADVREGVQPEASSKVGHGLRLSASGSPPDRASLRWRRRAGTDTHEIGQAKVGGHLVRKIRSHWLKTQIAGHHHRAPLVAPRRQQREKDLVRRDGMTDAAAGRVGTGPGSGASCYSNALERRSEHAGPESNASACRPAHLPESARNGPRGREARQAIIRVGDGGRTGGNAGGQGKRFGVSCAPLPRRPSPTPATATSLGLPAPLARSESARCAMACSTMPHDDLAVGEQVLGEGPRERQPAILCPPTKPSTTFCIAVALAADVDCPVVPSDAPPPLEQVGARIRRLHLVLHHVRQRRPRSPPAGGPSAPPPSPGTTSGNPCGTAATPW